MKIKVLSFNVQCGDCGDHYMISDRAPRLLKIIDREDPDLIGIQEYTPRWSECIDEKLSEKYGRFNKYRFQDSHESTPVFWKKEKFDCLKTGYFWLSDTPEVESKGWDEVCDCYRICTYALLKVKETGKELLYINTHYGFGDNGQVASGKLIHEYAEKLTGGNVIITGDFNMEPDYPGHAIMTENYLDVNDETVKDYSRTFHAFEGDNYKDDDGIHIDYCFVDKTVKPLNQKILTDSFDGYFPSDHYGLMNEVEI